MQIVRHILPFDRIADQEELSVAQFLGDVESAHGRDQDHRDAAQDTGEREREDHPPEDADAVAAEISGRFKQLDVHLRHDGVDRKDHIRQIVVHHADNDGAFRADDMHAAESQGGQQAVQDARILEDGHPRVRAYQEIHPHGDHDEDHHDLLPAFGRTRHDVSQRISEDQADHGADDRELQAPPEDEKIRMDFLPVHRAGGGEESGDIVEGKGESVVRERVIRDEDKRNDDEQGRPERVRRQGSPARFRIAGHSSSSSSSSGWLNSSSSLEKEE